MSALGDPITALIDELYFVLVRHTALTVSPVGNIKNTGIASNTCLVSVREGVLLETSDGYLEL